MASHQLAIAKASFSAGLLRPDPTSLNREDIAQFHSLLNAAIIQCTPKNVQKCKQWILENISQSTARFTALGKYLTALTASFTENGPNLDPTSKREPSVKRKRLHLLYLLNDILHHSKYRVNDASICGKVQAILVNLLGSAASFTGCPKHLGKLWDLLKLWEEKEYYSKEYIDKLRETVKNASEAGKYEEGKSTTAHTGDQDATAKAAKSAPYVMPATHGDSSTPWFDLPAGNLMPHIIPNSTRPINPDLIKPLQFVAGPADEELVIAVKGLLDDVQKIFGGQAGQDEKVSWDVDELGQPIMLDEITGDVLEGEGYYGWSRTFCEKMKRRRRGLDKPERNEDRGRTRRSQSRSSSRSRKRRRYSLSDDESSPDDYRRSRARRNYSSSQSRSRSPGINRPSNGPSRSRSRQRSYSRSPSRSPSPRKSEPYPREARQPSAPRPEGLPPKPQVPFNPPVPFQGGYNAQFPPPPPPFPPPPNMNFNGWPPPPPPPPLHGHPNNFNPSNASQNWPPAPPPPPNPHFQQHPGAYPPAGPGGWQPPMQHGNGRGYNNNGWTAPTGPQGRGGRGNYRGRGW